MKRITVGVFKLTSCSGCINELIYALVKHPELLKLIDVKYFTELQDVNALTEIDVAIIEGSSIRSEHEEILKKIRELSKVLVSMGTCATLGGVQSLRIGVDVNEVKKYVYPNPEYVDAYNDVKAVSELIQVDLSLRGCPVNGDALASIIKKIVIGGWPAEVYESLCADCKRAGIECVVVTKGTPCLGPIVSAGCGALCPSFGRGCYGCYGIKDKDIDSGKIFEMEKALERLGLSRDDFYSLLKGYSMKLVKSLKI